ncbi:tetratricopeptide repeat protein [Hymenobacter sp. NBH84]|uniref:tetratricopeptide repeat protein n=1 Tax=Hymenobacter sp. NBH84 TaxID=2596915 RepID=UPI0016264820|nr:tetratricopeptide repeat protein [Hymenobacter sp. NBH84]QNE38962.1 tetratricopeptide repeat protein [Hymenobacter sp. NBH84]
MKIFALLLVLLLSGAGGLDQLTRIHHRNVAVQEAQAAYARQDFAAAARAYQAAVVQYGATEDAIILNLAHSCLRAGQSALARAYYGQLLDSPTRTVRSVAQQQLALLASQRGEYAQAVRLLRQALLASPTNADARYNYELLRDYLARRQQSPDIPPPAVPPTAPAPKKPTPPQEQQQQQRQADTGQQGQRNDPTLPDDPRNAPQPRADQQGQPNANQPDAAPGSAARGGFRPGGGTRREVATGNAPGTVRGLSNDETGPTARQGASRRAGTDLATDESQLQTQRARLEQMNLSPDKARQLLNALGAAEQQYLQQIPHKAEKKPDSDKPAW